MTLTGAESWCLRQLALPGAYLYITGRYGFLGRGRNRVQAVGVSEVHFGNQIIRLDNQEFDLENVRPFLRQVTENPNREPFGFRYVLNLGIAKSM